MHAYPHLFSPITIGNMVVPNRVCHLPTDISSSHADGSVSARDIHHHTELAKGGTGLIIVGATTPDAKTGRPTVTGLVADNDNFIPGLARLAAGMHRYGAKCVVQLQHPGRQSALPRNNYMSTNDMVVKIPWSAGHEIVYENAQEKGKQVRAMATEEVLEMVELFSEAAWRVQAAGFDGVELHAAHGYLIAQFMSPYINRRIDRFGGSFENRMRFPLAIVSSIRKKCGKDFPILVRYSAEEWIPGGRELAESILVAKEFEQAGVAALDISQSMQERPGAGFNPMYYPEAWSMYASEAIKKEVRIPIISGRVMRNPAQCEAAVAEGKTDLVGLSRQMLADPYWAVKAYHGKTEEIRRCISCLTGCWQESMMAKNEIKCAINPACGNEMFQDMKKAESPLSVAIVGGGPAGMEAARIAAVRGHKPVIFEKTGELGGAILGCCMVPGKDKMKWYADWIRGQMKALSVEIHLNHAPSAEELKGFDIVLNATGASAYRPEIYGERERIVPFEEAIRCPRVNCEFHPGNRTPQKLGERVVVLGDHYPAADTASYLASIGKRVTIVTENKEFGSSMEVIHRYLLNKLFRQIKPEALDWKPFAHPVTIITGTKAMELTGTELKLIDRELNVSVIEADSVVSCLLRPNTELFEQLRSQGIPCANVGDAVAPRNLHAAVREGALFSLTLEEKLLLNSNGAVLSNLPLDVAGQLLR